MPNSLLNFYYFLGIYWGDGWVCMTQYECEGKRTTFQGWVSPSTMEIPNIKCLLLNVCPWIPLHNQRWSWTSDLQFCHFHLPSAGIAGALQIPGLYGVGSNLGLVVWHYSWGAMNIHLLAPGRKPMTNQSTDTTQVQLVESVSFIGVILLATVLLVKKHHDQSIYKRKNWIGGLLIVPKSESMTIMVGSTEAGRQAQYWSHSWELTFES